MFSYEIDLALLNNGFRLSKEGLKQIISNSPQIVEPRDLDGLTGEIIIRTNENENWNVLITE